MSPPIDSEYRPRRGPPGLLARLGSMPLRFVVARPPRGVLALAALLAALSMAPGCKESTDHRVPPVKLPLRWDTGQWDVDKWQ